MNQSGEVTEDHVITLADIREALQAEVICGDEKLCDAVETACGCDLMSDVLAFTKPGSVLLTGLTNQQVVRTAEMLDLKAIIFVRNKQPDQVTLQLAQSKEIPLLLSQYPLYESCGRLFTMGLKGCNDPLSDDHACAPSSEGKNDPDDAKTSCEAPWWGD